MTGHQRLWLVVGKMPTSRQENAITGRNVSRKEKQWFELPAKSISSLTYSVEGGRESGARQLTAACVCHTMIAAGYVNSLQPERHVEVLLSRSGQSVVGIAHSASRGVSEDDTPQHDVVVQKPPSMKPAQRDAAGVNRW